MEKMDALRAKHSFIKEVRGKGLMIGIEFHEPQEFKLKMAWKLLHKIDKVLFAQMIVTQMLSKHRILTQVAGHAMDVMKILPPLIIGEKEVDMFVNALDDVLTECRKFRDRCGRLEIISSKPRLVQAHGRQRGPPFLRNHCHRGDVRILNLRRSLQDHSTARNDRSRLYRCRSL